ncbi:MAG TPA: HEAT repeat domain-containing protein [Candidatus Ozemobacteraceae bacterium]|nr:HEAT repeat domain-containing protein [Candidatus Ozemobacteraceae bacterium]
MIWPFHSARPPQDLIKDLSSGDASTRDRAARELIDHDSPQTDLLLIAALKNSDEEPRPTRLKMIEVIGKRGIEDAVDHLSPFLTEEDRDLRAETLHALIRIPTQTSLDGILPLLIDEDNAIKREARESILRVFGMKAMGAILRAIPDDKTSPLYFELVSLFEEMGFFDVLSENFAHDDEEVKKFHLPNLMKFHRPDFVPMYLSLADTASTTVQAQIRDALCEYTPDELLPHIEALFRQGVPNRHQLRMIEDCLFQRHPNAKEELLHLVIRIPKNEIRYEFAQKTLRKPDTILFLPALQLLEDPYPAIRQTTGDALMQVIRQTRQRLDDPGEPNKAYLRELIQSWRNRVVEIIKLSPSRDALIALSKVLFALLDAKHLELVIQALPKLFEECFLDTWRSLSSLDADIRNSLLGQALKEDPGLVSQILDMLNRQPNPDLMKLLLKNVGNLTPEHQSSFQKHVSKKSGSYKLRELLDDSDPQMRASTLEFLAQTSFDGINTLLSRAILDPSPLVRQKGLDIAIQRKHPDLAHMTEKAAQDPDPTVALTALRHGKTSIDESRLAPMLAKAVQSPSEELREFALREIARITQKRYVENFNRMPPHVRKLAGSALLKLDTGFVDQLLGDLRSLDTETRLRAAMIFENLQAAGKAREGLLAAMKDPSNKVRAAVVKSLGVLADHSLLSHLIEFLSDPDERVRANTIEAIAAAGNREAANLLVPFLEDANNRIRANAALAVWQIARLNILPVLTRMLRDKQPVMRASALWVCGEVKQPEHLRLIMSFLNDPNDLVRVNAVKAVMKIRPEVLKPVLPKLRRDSSPEIKKLVAELSFKII